MTDDLISRAAALDALDQHAHGATTLGGQTYRSITLEVAVEAIRALPAVDDSQTPDPVVKADRQQSVRVKPLVWAFSKSTQAHRADASVSGEIYLVWKMANGWVLSMRAGDTTHITLDNAKAAAQADYEQRILAAIETQPDTRDVVIAQLVEAGNHLSFMAQTSGGTAGRDDALVLAIGAWCDAAIAAAKGGAA